MERVKNVEVENYDMLKVCVYCGGYSEYPRALCVECFDAHKAKACEELRPMACHGCNMIDEWEG
jgi:uncharacterized OB-fold protein